MTTGTGCYNIVPNTGSLALAMRFADAVKAAGLPPATRITAEEDDSVVVLEWELGKWRWFRAAFDSPAVRYRHQDGSNFAEGQWTPPAEGDLELPSSLLYYIGKVTP